MVLINIPDDQVKFGSEEKGTFYFADMEKVLQSIFVHVDAAYNTLADKAIAQLLVKLLYMCDHPLKKDELVQLADSQTHVKLGHYSGFDNILDELAQKREVLFHKGKYGLSTAKREKIKKSINNSKDRVDRLVSEYFSGLYSDIEIIKQWFLDVTFKFFEIYADHWIADLLAGSQNIRNLGESIRTTVENRTKSFNDLDKRDVFELTHRFFRLVTSRNPDVDAYLWEHGTSRFSALLISNKQGVDRITLESFSGSTCILDTNVLIFIALGAEGKRKSFEQLEIAFEQLGISVNVLYITKAEYEHRVDFQRDLTIKNIEKMGGLTTKVPNDSFTQCARERHCTRKDDFAIFFDELRKMPQYVTNRLKLKVLDHGLELAKAVESAQQDEAKKEHLKRLYRETLHREKPENATIHDVGLIEGVEYLRKSGKFFILSEETSVNAYSQNKPTEKGLPLSIRVETLLNLLVANGNQMTDSADYMSLYADLIRLDLMPAEKSFSQYQLFQMHNLSSQISKLPEDETERIVWEAHDKMVRGMKDEELRLFLNDKITETEISLKDEITKHKEELADMKEGLKAEVKSKDQYRSALYEKLYSECKFKILCSSVFRFVIIPVVVLLAGICLSYFLYVKCDEESKIWAIVGSLIATVILDIFYVCCKFCKDGWNMYRHRCEIADQQAMEQLERYEAK